MIPLLSHCLPSPNRLSLKGTAITDAGLEHLKGLKNLRKAVALHLEGENASQFGLHDRPILLVTRELDRLRRVH